MFSSNFFTLKIHPTKTLDLALVMRNMPWPLYSHCVKHTVIANVRLKKLPSHSVTRPTTHYPTPLSPRDTCYLEHMSHCQLDSWKVSSVYSLLFAKVFKTGHVSVVLTGYRAGPSVVRKSFLESATRWQTMFVWVRLSYITVCMTFWWVTLCGLVPTFTS